MNQKCPRCRKNNSPLGMVIVADLCTRIEYACDCGCRYQDFKDIKEHHQDTHKVCPRCGESKPRNTTVYSPSFAYCRDCEKERQRDKRVNRHA